MYCLWISKVAIWFFCGYWLRIDTLMHLVRPMTCRWTTSLYSLSLFLSLQQSTIPWNSYSTRASKLYTHLATSNQLPLPRAHIITEKRPDLALHPNSLTNLLFIYSLFSENTFPKLCTCSLLTYVINTLTCRITIMLITPTYPLHVLDQPVPPRHPI